MSISEDSDSVRCISERADSDSFTCIAERAPAKPETEEV